MSEIRPGLHDTRHSFGLVCLCVGVPYYDHVHRLTFNSCVKWVINMCSALNLSLRDNPETCLSPRRPVYHPGDLSTTPETCLSPLRPVYHPRDLSITPETCLSPRRPVYHPRDLSTTPETFLSPRRLVSSEEHTSALQAQTSTSYAVFCLKKKLPVLL